MTQPFLWSQTKDGPSPITIRKSASNSHEGSVTPISRHDGPEVLYHVEKAHILHPSIRLVQRVEMALPVIPFFM